MCANTKTNSGKNKRVQWTSSCSRTRQVLWETGKTVVRNMYRPWAFPAWSKAKVVATPFSDLTWETLSFQNGEVSNIGNPLPMNFQWEHTGGAVYSLSNLRSCPAWEVLLHNTLEYCIMQGEFTASVSSTQVLCAVKNYLTLIRSVKLKKYEVRLCSSCSYFVLVWQFRKVNSCALCLGKLVGSALLAFVFSPHWLFVSFNCMFSL